MAASIEFFTVRDQPGPVWARTYGLSADGTILLPAVAVNATDAHAFLCGYHDGITVGRCHRRFEQVISAKIPGALDGQLLTYS